MKTDVEYLPDRRIVRLFGPINDSTVVEMREALAHLNTQNTRSQIFLQINSTSGETEAGLDIYHMVRLSKAPITGIVILKAFGASAVILQGCTFRGASAHAEISIYRDNDCELQDPIDGIYMNRVGCSLLTVKEMRKKERRMSAYEAFERKLIDRIL